MNRDQGSSRCTEGGWNEACRSLQAGQCAVARSGHQRLSLRLRDRTCTRASAQACFHKSAGDGSVGLGRNCRLGHTCSSIRSQLAALLVRPQKCSRRLSRSELVLAKNAQPPKVLIRRGLTEDTDSQVQSKRCDCAKLLLGTIQTWHWIPVPQAARLQRCEADPLPCYSSLSAHSLTKRHDTGTPATVGQRSRSPRPGHKQDRRRSARDVEHRSPPMLTTAPFGVLEQDFRGAIDDAETHFLECPHGHILRAAEPELRTP